MHAGAFWPRLCNNIFGPVAALLIPLAVIFTPLVGNATGFYTMGITANESGLRFMGLAGMLGGAALIGSIWLLTTRHNKP